MARPKVRKSRGKIKSKPSRPAGARRRFGSILPWVVGLIGIVLLGETVYLFKKNLIVAKDYPVQKMLSFDGANQECGDISPWDLEVCKDWIAVCDQAHNRIVLFDHQGNYLRAITEQMAGSPKFKEISCLTIDAKNNIYVIDAWNGMIRGFTPLGRPTVKLPINRCYGPRGIAWDNGAFIVCDTGTHRILRIASDGSQLKAFGTRGSTDGMIEGPESVALDSQGHLYIVDSGNNRVVCMDSEGRFIRNFAIGTRPSIVTVDRVRDLLYVATPEGGVVKVFKTDGRYEGNLTSATPTEPILTNLKSIRAMENGDLVVGSTEHLFIYRPVSKPKAPSAS